MHYTPPVSLVGRDELLSSLRAALGEHRVVTLVGPPGAGKSALARAHAEPRGAPVRGVGRGSAALPAESDLVVLDGADAGLAGARDVVRGWLSASTERRVLVTSRQRLGAPGEHALEVPPLDPDAAAALFLERARALRPDYATQDDSEELVARIATLCDHLPLALELAAARAALLDPVDLLRRLHDPLDVLRSADDPGRSLRNRLEASIIDLDDGRRAALAWLSAFDGPFDIDAAEAVAGARRAQGGHVLDRIQALADRSLLCKVASSPGGGARFELLRVVRAYARELLEADGEADAAARAHASWLAGRVWRHTAALGGPRGPEALRLLGLHGASILSVLDAGTALAADDAARLGLALDALHRHGRPARRADSRHDLAGSASPLRDAIDVALGASSDACPSLRAALVAARERLRRLAGAPHEALRNLDAAPADVPAVGLERAACLAAAGRTRDAIAAARAVHTDLVARRADPVAELDAAALTASLLTARGHIDNASTLLDDALAATSSRVGPLAHVPCLLEAARVELLRARPARAGSYLDDATRILRPWDAPRRLGEILLLQAEATGDTGCLDQALALYRRAGDRRGEADAHEAAAEAHLEAGRLDAAIDDASRALRLRRALRDVRGQVDALELLGLLEWAQGDHGAAATRFGAASEIVGELQDGSAAALVASLRAAIAAVVGNVDGAADARDRVEDLLGATSHRAPPPSIFAHCAHLDLLRAELDPGAAQDYVAAAAERIVEAVQTAGALRRQDHGLTTSRRRGARLRMALRRVTERLPDGVRLAAWADALDPRGRALLLDGDGAHFRAPGGDWKDIARFGTQRRLLVLIARSHGGPDVTSEDIQAALWPDERILPEAAANRIHKVVSQLRKAGLGDCLERTAEGYRLAVAPVALPDLPLRAP